MEIRLIDAEALIRAIHDLDGIEGHEELYYRIANMVVAAPTITQPNEWVSVEDRLPEVFTPVLVCREDGKVEQGCRDALGIWITFETRKECVTHWMPLPARPPEGKED